MGRGRAKAKQTKVARKLKYTTPETDLASLEAELVGRPEDDTAEDSPLEDPYAKYVEDEDESR